MKIVVVGGSGLVGSKLVSMREVIADPQARYFGTKLSERSLVAGDEAQLGEIRFEDWLRAIAQQNPDSSHAPAVPTTSRIVRARTCGPRRVTC